MVTSRLEGRGKTANLFYSATVHFFIVQQHMDCSAELVPEVGSTWQLLHPFLQHVHLVEEICQQAWLFVVEVK